MLEWGEVGKLFVVAGVALIVLGGVLMLSPKLPAFTSTFGWLSGAAPGRYLHQARQSFGLFSARHRPGDQCHSQPRLLSVLVISEAVTMRHALYLMLVVLVWCIADVSSAAEWIRVLLDRRVQKSHRAG